MTTHAISYHPAAATTGARGRVVGAFDGARAWLEARARSRAWLLTTYAVAAALVVCLAMVIFTPIEPPTSWRSDATSVSGGGRHSAREDSLGL